MNRIAVLFAACVGIPSACFAQGDWADVPIQFSLRAGIFAPITQELRDLNDIWFTAGADAEVIRGFFPNATTVVSVDWMSRNGGAGENLVPVTLSQRWYQGDWPKRTFFHVGLGPVFTDFNPSDVVIGARGGFGFEVNDRLFLEANFYLTDKVRQGFYVLGGAGFVGVRF